LSSLGPYDGVYAQFIDAKGLNCPLPLLKMKKALALAQIGERVYMQATDPNTLRDLSDYATQAKYPLVYANSTGAVFHLVIEKAEPRSGLR
jgi:tRNA 2-thiouridine synthesizing protein A